MKGKKGSCFKYNLPDIAALEQFIPNVNPRSTKFRELTSELLKSGSLDCTTNKLAAEQFATYHLNNSFSSPTVWISNMLPNP